MSSLLSILNNKVSLCLGNRKRVMKGNEKSGEGERRMGGASSEEWILGPGPGAGLQSAGSGIRVPSSGS